MEQRVHEDGKSEGPTVMGGIEVEPNRQHHLTRKRADFHLVSQHERAWLPAKGAKQMTGEINTTVPRAGAGVAPGAAPHPPTDWHAIPWRQVEREVRRLQARIVQATQAG